MGQKFNMGEANRKPSVTEIMIREHPLCCFCAGTRATETREHMPPKAMFDGSHRPDRLVMPACKECNSKTSTADLISSVISRWRFKHGSEKEQADHKRLIAQVRLQAPHILEEWRSMESHQEFARAHLGQFISIPAENAITVLGPETIRQLNIFAHKLVLGLYFQKYKMALPSEGCVWAFWKTKEDIVYGGRPDFLLGMLPDYGSLIQGQWDARETFEFRTGGQYEEGTFGCFARLRGGLYMGGLALRDASLVDNDSGGWTRPAELLLDGLSERFSKRDVE